MKTLRALMRLFHDHLGAAQRGRKGRLFYPTLGLKAHLDVANRPADDVYRVAFKIDFPHGPGFQSKHEALRSALATLPGVRVTAGNPKNQGVATRLNLAYHLPRQDARKNVHVSPNADPGQVAGLLREKLETWAQTPPSSEEERAQAQAATRQRTASHARTEIAERAEAVKRRFASRRLGPRR